MSSINSNEIISILKEEIENFDMMSKDSEVGTVITVGDGIASIYGIDHAMYGEIVTFENGLKGMVQDIRRNEIGCILFGSDTRISEGTKVTRTGKRAGVPVGDAYIGRVVNALGEPIDGKGSIEADGYRPIEQEAPGIVDRKSVSVPMETGILSIDSMFPIGRGQRELIIGDRQTGKTSIALDTILNQKDKDVICVYVSIGQKASTVAKVVNTLKTNGALDYTIVVSSTASDCAPLQYIAPYAGTAMAEYFMYKGKDVLIVYDDLSKHAVAYRALSLLLGRSPGRDSAARASVALSLDARSFADADEAHSAEIFSDLLAAILLASAEEALFAAACSEALVFATSCLISSTLFSKASATSSRKAYMSRHWSAPSRTYTAAISMQYAMLVGRASLFTLYDAPVDWLVGRSAMSDILST